MRVTAIGHIPVPDSRLFVVIAFGAIAAAAAPTQGEELSPFRARVIAASASVLSGPDQKFYPTDTLAEGEIVEVYRRQPNGWCAIRPPEGSFSWVFGRHVKLHGDAEGDSVAEIDKDDVASRIGSRLSSHRNAVQVRLKKGEALRVLGEELAEGETWYKVSPPAGEFRWIHASRIKRVDVDSDGSPGQRQGERLESKDASPVSNALALTPMPAPNYDLAQTSNTSNTAPAQTPTHETATNSAPTLKQSPADVWRAAPEPLQNMLAAPPLTAENTLDKTPGTALGDTQPATIVAPGKEIAGAAENSRETTPASAAQPRSLIDLELRLSRMVAAPPQSWNTAPLKAEAEALLAQAPIPTERNSIQATIAKLDRFAAIERRSRGVTGTAIDGQNYDAVGVLRPVNSRRPGAPPFALVDERGQVVSFVTPTPGVNLQPYLGQRIGVTGSRGYIPEFQRGHVVAGRAAPVTERIVR